MKSLLVFLIFILISSSVNCQEPNIGDTIDVTIGSKTKRGEFIGYASNGRLVKIRTMINGKTYELSYPNRNVKIVERKGTTNKGTTQKADGSKFRTWKDKTGRFELSAKLVAVSKTSVTLERQDGKQIDVPLEKLSDADQKYLASRNKPTSIKPKGVLESDVTEVKKLSINGPEIWNVSIEPLTAAVDGPAEISTPPVHRSVDGVLLTQDRKRFFFPGTAPNAPNFYLVNLNDGSLAWQGKSSARITRRTIPTDVASNSTTVVYAGSELYVATLRPSGAITGLVQWTPYKPVELDAAYAANWVKFVGDQHLLTSSAHLGTVVLWDWYNAKAIWRIETSPGSTPILSPDRKTLILHKDNQLCFLDPLSGDVLGRIDCPHRGLTNFALSPSGNRLAVCGSRLIRVFDLQKQSKLPDVGVFSNAYSGGGDNGHPVWINEDILYWRRYFDVNKSIRLELEAKFRHPLLLFLQCQFRSSESGNRPAIRQR